MHNSLDELEKAIDGLKHAVRVAIIIRAGGLVPGASVLPNQKLSNIRISSLSDLRVGIWC